MTRKRSIAVVTTTRADYGLLLPILRVLARDRRVHLRLLVSGTHLLGGFGNTLQQIRRDGFARNIEQVRVPLHGDSAADLARVVADTTRRFADLFRRKPPDILLVLGDRVEILGVVAAALPFNVPVAHVHGGEITRGAIDDSCRHAISKMSHLHFVSTRAHADRLRRMGEEPWRIVVSGAPGLDLVASLDATPARRLSHELGIEVDRGTLLVTFHPETRGGRNPARDVDELLAALDRAAAPTIVTAPNADTGRSTIASKLRGWTTGHRERVFVHSLGQQKYLSLMAAAGAMVGNSSSGIIEAPSFRLPVVNVGDRQSGRVRAQNVIDVPAERGAIYRAVRRALSPAFRRRLAGMSNPYGRGRAGVVIARKLSRVPLNGALVMKEFYDSPGEGR